MQKLIAAYQETLSHKKAALICGLSISSAYRILKGCGVIVSENHRLSKVGERNPNWKEKPKNTPLHQWVNRNKPKGSKCESCGKTKPLDAANISGEYKRDINDFEWLCRSCHMQKDGRMKNLKQYA